MAEDAALPGTGHAADGADGAEVVDRAPLPDAASAEEEVTDAASADEQATDGLHATDGLQAMDRLADDVLPALVARLGVSRLAELEIRHAGWRVRLRRSLAAPAEGSSGRNGDTARGGRLSAAGGRGEAIVRTPGSRGGTAIRSLVAVGPGGDATAPGDGRPEPLRLTARSPAVGYYAPRDGLAVGQSVRAGDLLGHVDVLGVRQEVVSPADGFIGRVIGEQGEAVEYGQDLVRVDLVVRPAERSREADLARRDERATGG